MFYRGPDQPTPPYKPPSQSKYPIEIRNLAMAKRDIIERELKIIGRAPTEEEARLLVLYREIIEGEESQ